MEQNSLPAPDALNIQSVFETDVIFDLCVEGEQGKKVNNFPSAIA